MEIRPISEVAIRSIADMPAWCFWSRDGVSDLASLRAREREEVYVTTRMAIHYLRDVVPPGTKEWMTVRRAMN